MRAMSVSQCVNVNYIKVRVAVSVCCHAPLKVPSPECNLLKRHVKITRLFPGNMLFCFLFYYLIIGFTHKMHFLCRRHVPRRCLRDVWHIHHTHLKLLDANYFIAPHERTPQCPAFCIFFSILPGIKDERKQNRIIFSSNQSRNSFRICFTSLFNIQDDNSIILYNLSFPFY